MNHQHGKQISKLLVLFGLLIFSSLILAAPALVKKARVAHQLNKTRLVLELNKNVKYNSFLLKKPARLVIDIAKSHWDAKLDTTDLAKTYIQHIRTGKHGSDLRIVIDLRTKIKVSSFVLPANSQFSKRIVFDLVAVPKNKKWRKKINKQKTAQVPKPIISVLRTGLRKKIVVMIDPGHGGKAPGAIGAHGGREKHVVLAIARALKRQLDREPGIKAILTRRCDCYVGLRRRLFLARRDKADIFIAIHADAFKYSRSRGASVYAVSQRGASSEAARWLAERENQAELLGGADLGERDYLTRSVLLDLSQTATIGASLKLGARVLRRLSKIARLHYPRVQQAGFVVLKSPDIPSILVETGFISNPHEERLLRSAQYQDALAKAIAKGVKSYFLHNPPQHTLFAALRQNSHRYIVRRGDTLAKISKRYKVNVYRIRLVNILSGRKVKVGQVLRIPA